MDANEREKIRIIRRLRAGTESSGGATTLIDANERKEVKISADYIDYADYGFEDDSIGRLKKGPRFAGTEASSVDRVLEVK